MARGELDRKQPRPEQERELLGWLKEFLKQFELAWKLLWDRRVSGFTKLVPLATLAYLILPVDIVPDPVLGLGQVDDLVLILLGLKMFISLCPPDVVAELENPDSAADPAWRPPVEEIIDLEPQMPPVEEAPRDIDQA
ncbi:MAG: DUF1232 domain-containing protein [Anaerolineae bacterium]|jgi:uncharacterized membrane protein YkvA (DUF1232 family)|nr:DUF1232 domain-containing protein [Anaerolineae bacterium]